MLGLGGSAMRHTGRITELSYFFDSRADRVREDNVREQPPALRPTSRFRAHDEEDNKDRNRSLTTRHINQED